MRGGGMLLLLLAVFAVASAKVDYTGYAVWRVAPRTELQVKQLYTLMATSTYDFWKEDFSVDTPAEIMVSPADASNLLRWLARRGLQHSVKIANVQSLIDSEEHYMKSLKPLTSRVDLDTSRYYSLEELYDFLETSAEENDNAEIFETGLSYEGRSIKGIKISGSGDEEDRRAVWLDCGIHAREWISPAICQYAIDRLLNSDEESDVAAQQGFDWYVYPSVNPDGYAFTWEENRMWRKTRKPNANSTCIGVDGNRNFGGEGYGGLGSSDLPCSETYRGEEAFSSEEVANLDSFVRGVIAASGPVFDLGITIHSYGQFMVYPWGFTRDKDPDNIDDLDDVCQSAVREIVAENGISFNGRRSNGDMAGNTIDWARETGQMAFSYLYEVRDTGEYGFILPPEQIEPTDREIWAGVRQMALEIMELRKRRTNN